LTPSSGTALTVPIGDNQFSFNAAVLTLNPTNDILDSVQYTANVEATALSDGPDRAYAGISGTSWQFMMVDETVPTLSTYSPAQGKTAVTRAGNLAFTFVEAVQQGTGDVVLTPSSGTALTVPIGDNQFSFNASLTLTM